MTRPKSSLAYRRKRLKRVDYGSKLRAKRQAMGLTMTEVSNLTGISLGHLSAIECGSVSPGDKYREAFIRLFGEL